VVECLEAALWCFDRTDSFEAAVLEAVNLGDDADTTGAVCGEIAGLAERRRTHGAMGGRGRLSVSPPHPATILPRVARTSPHRSGSERSWPRYRMTASWSARSTPALDIASMASAAVMTYLKVLSGIVTFAGDGGA
jgi:hypothetical protein